MGNQASLPQEPEPLQESIEKKLVDPNTPSNKAQLSEPIPIHLHVAHSTSGVHFSTAADSPPFLVPASLDTRLTAPRLDALTTPSPALDKLPEKVAVLISWVVNSGAQSEHVSVSGSFNQWREPVPLLRHRDEFTVIMEWPPGMHRFRFLVDGQWKCSPDYDTAVDDEGMLVNFISIGSTKEEWDSSEESAHSDESDVYLDWKYSQDIPSFLLLKSPSARAPCGKPTYGSWDQSYDHGGYSTGFDTPENSFQSRNRSLSVHVKSTPLPPPMPPYLNSMKLPQPQPIPIQQIQAFELTHQQHHYVSLNHLYTRNIVEGLLGVATLVREGDHALALTLYQSIHEDAEEEGIKGASQS